LARNWRHIQQVQKYEKRHQSRELQPALRDIGCVGSADRFFLHGLGHAGLSWLSLSNIDVPELKDGIHLMTAFRQIPNVAIRKSFITFVESLAGELNPGRLTGLSFD